MRYVAIVLLLFGLCSCFQRPISEGPSQNNKTYEVSYLFEHDGCKVYRFYDLGHYVYFTNCKGETMFKSDSASVSRNMISVEKAASGTGNH